MRTMLMVILMCLMALQSGCGPSGDDNTQVQKQPSGDKKASGGQQRDKSVVREGVFVFEVPRDFSRIPVADLEGLKTAMYAGGRELAIMSNSADPQLFKEEYLTFFAGYQVENRRVQIIMMGEELPVSMERDDMFRTNAERIEWGKKAGQLSKESAGVTRLKIGGVPALLMDIVSLQGERLQTYTFFHSDYPKHSFAISIKVEKRGYGNHAQSIEALINTVKLDLGAD